MPAPQCLSSLYLTRHHYFLLFFVCVRGVRLLMVGRDIVLAVSLTSIDYWSNRKDLADLFFGGGLFITIAVVSIAPRQDCGAAGRDTCG
jgi:hypothetical protein